MTKAEFSVDDRDYARWLVTEAIYKRYKVSKDSNLIVLKPKEHLKEVYSDDVHSIIGELAYEQRAVKVRDPSLYTMDKAKVENYKRVAHEVIWLEIITDVFLPFYQELKEIYAGASGNKGSKLQMLTLEIRGLRKLIITYKKILLGMANDRYGQSLESDTVTKETASEIHFAITKALIPDAPDAKLIAEKFREAIKIHRNNWKSSLGKKKRTR